MAITLDVQSKSFPPKTVRAMGEAFDAACSFMALGSNEPMRRQVIARLILTLARADGEADALALRDRAVKLLSDIRASS